MMYRLKPRFRMSVAVAVLLTTLVSAASASASSSPVWLCKPGLAHDPCTPGLSTTVYTAKLHELGVEHPTAVSDPAVDCFYVYPTVSEEPTGNSNLQIQPAERSVALYQAARYSQYCKVYAPMYQQVTIAGIGVGPKPTTPPSRTLALSSVTRAFNYYLAHYNHGRGFILIGHSQGSFELEQLIAKEIDRRPALRHRLVSAILLGGNVLVKKGRAGAGGDFKHIPACRSNTQLHCVIAYSSFDEPVPNGSLFGTPSGVGNSAPASPDDVVLCTNPAALAGGTAIIHPIFASAPFAPGGPFSFGTVFNLVGLTNPRPRTTWYTLRRAYSARCVTSNGANVLMITPLAGAQVPKPSPTPVWGEHLIDANIELGDLLKIERAEAAAFAKRHG